MPCYDYKCPNCDTEFELIVSKPDPDIAQSCIKCGTPSPTYMPLKSRSGVKFFFNYMAPDA